MYERMLQDVLEGRLGPLASVSVVGEDHDVTDSYTSDMSRVRVRVVTGSGERRELCLLVKRSCLGDVNNDVFKDAAELSTEIKIYSEVLPSMESLMTTMGIPDETLWAHCIGHCDTTLVLEDLQVLGYRTCDRTRGLDYHHAALATKGLAQFHALSVVLEDKGDLQPLDFSKFVFDGGYEHINGFITSSFQYLHRVAAREWSPEWKDIIENVRNIPEMAVEKLREITELQNGGFHVLNHGDTWVNNMMFKHNDIGPVSVRFVDYQLSHYNSYAFDLHYLLNTSISTEVLHHIDRLYEEYHYHLTTELARLGRTDGPSLSELCTELERTEFFGLFSAVAVAPVIMAKQEIAPPKDNTGYTLTELERRKEERYRTEEYTKRIQVILRRAKHGGLFKRLFM